MVVVEYWEIQRLNGRMERQERVVRSPWRRASSDIGTRGSGVTRFEGSVDSLFMILPVPLGHLGKSRCWASMPSFAMIHNTRGIFLEFFRIPKTTCLGDGLSSVAFETFEHV